MTDARALPAVSMARLFALLEVVDRTVGPDDVYRLGQALRLDLDELLPLLEAARLLDWVVVAAGDYDLTPEGRRVARAGSRERQRLLRARALHLPLIAMIARAFEHRGHVSRQTIAAALPARFGVAEVERQIDTAVDWGRQAEVFDYDADAACFHRPHRH